MPLLFTPAHRIPGAPACNNIQPTAPGSRRQRRPLACMKELDHHLQDYPGSDMCAAADQHGQWQFWRDPARNLRYTPRLVTL